jgi:hypothetical protein
MLRRVALVRADVSEELSASFIRVTRICELGTALAVTSEKTAFFIVAALKTSNLTRCTPLVIWNTSQCGVYMFVEMQGKPVVHLFSATSLICFRNSQRISILCSFWPGIQRLQFRLPALPHFVTVGLKWGPLSLVRIIEELLEWRSSCSGVENGD